MVQAKIWSGGLTSGSPVPFSFIVLMLRANWKHNLNPFSGECIQAHPWSDIKPEKGVLSEEGQLFEQD